MSLLLQFCSAHSLQTADTTDLRSQAHSLLVQLLLSEGEGLDEGVAAILPDLEACVGEEGVGPHCHLTLAQAYLSLGRVSEYYIYLLIMLYHSGLHLGIFAWGGGHTAFLYAVENVARIAE